MQIARRMGILSGLQDAFASFELLDQMLREGVDIVDFTVGDPDFDTPAHIAEAGISAIGDGRTHYTAARGIAPLRQRIAESLSASRQVEFDAEEIVVAPGAKILVTYALLALINRGDEVIVPDPCYPAYRSMVEFVGGVPVPMPLLEERSFAFDPVALAALVGDKTRMIILNSPNNPTGGVLAESDLEAVAEIAKSRDIWVLSDEVYSEMVYEGQFVSMASIAGMTARTVLLDSFSKTYAMTGWRLGYGAAPKAVADAMSMLAGNIQSSAAEFTQYAGLAALEGPRAPVEAMVKAYRERRDLLWEGLNKLPGFSCVKANGAFYLFPNVSGACQRLGLKKCAGVGGVFAARSAGRGDQRRLLLSERGAARESPEYSIVVRAGERADRGRNAAFERGPGRGWSGIGARVFATEASVGK